VIPFSHTAEEGIADGTRAVCEAVTGVMDSLMEQEKW